MESFDRRIAFASEPSNALIRDANWRRSFDGDKSCANLRKQWRLPVSASPIRGCSFFLGCRVSGCNLDAAAHYVPQLPRLRHTNLPKVIYWQLRKVHFAIFQIAKARRQTHQLRPIRASLTSGLKLKLKLNCD